MTPAALVRLAEDHPAHGITDSFHDFLHAPDRYFDGCRIRLLPATYIDELRAILALTDGVAALLLCWEGGDRYTGLLVNHGEVTEGRVVQTVVPK